MQGDVKKIYKKISIALIILYISTCFLGCTKTNGTNNKNISVNEIDEKIKQSVDISNLKKVDGEKLLKLYGINPDEIDEFILYIASTNIEADEVAIFKVKDEKDANSIKDKIQERVEGQLEDFKDYLPIEYDLLENHIIKCNGRYILFVVSDKAENILKEFEEALK